MFPPTGPLDTLQRASIVSVHMGNFMGRLGGKVKNRLNHTNIEQLYSDDRHGKMRDLEISSDPDPQNILRVFLKPLFICYVITLHRYLQTLIDFLHILYKHSILQ